MDFIGLLVLLVFVFNLTLSTFTFFISNRDKSLSTKIFSIFGFAISFWCFGMLAFRGVSLEFATDAAKLLYFAASFTPSTFLLFAFAFGENKIDTKKWFPVIIANIIVAIGTLSSDFVSSVIEPESGERIINFEILYFILYTIYIPVTFVLGFTVLINKFRHSKSKIQRQQILLIFTGSFLTSSIAMFTNLMLPTFEYFELNWVGQVSTVIWLSAIAFSILRYKLFDIRLLLGRISYFLVLGFVLFISFNFFLYVNLEVFEAFFTIEVLIINFILAVIYAIAFNYIDKFLKDSVNSKLINPGFDPVITINNFNYETSTQLNSQKIGELAQDFITKNLKSQFCIIDIHEMDESNTVISLVDWEALTEEIENYWQNSGYRYINSDLLVYESNSNQISYELESLLKTLKQNKTYLVMPVISKIEKKYLGKIIIGGKEGRYGYDKYEIDFIKEIANSLATAISRSLLYEEVKQFNATLQQKVDNATIELQVKNTQLAEALRKEKDMMDILGHELRTPLGTARNAIAMMETLKKKGKLDEPTLDKYMDIALGNIRREKDLLETILQSARLENSRMQFANTRFDMKEVIESSITSFSPSAEEKGLELIKEAPEAPIEVSTDRTVIQQVTDNLVSNAIKYTYHGNVTIILEDLGDAVKVSVQDTGEGLKEKDIKNIGKKFYRANTHLDTGGKIGDRGIVRPGGTGIGLYVVKGILKSMNSELEIESEFGKGSTFSFTLQKEPEYREDMLLDPEAQKNDLKKISKAGELVKQNNSAQANNSNADNASNRIRENASKLLDLTSGS